MIKRHCDDYKSRVGAKWFLLWKCVPVVLLLSILALSGCKKNDEPLDNEPGYEDEDDSDDSQVEEDPEDVTDSPDGTDITNPPEQEVKEVLNNGGYYVEYKGNVYYREYNASSYESEGIWATYSSVPNSTKNMMRIKPDNTKEIAFTDTGEGNIYIYKDRMYLSRLETDYTPTIYSVNLDGSDRKDIGTGFIKAFDEATGIFVCVLPDSSNEYQLASLNASTGEVKFYALNTPYANFLALKDGVIFYQGAMDENQLSQIKLCSLMVDGTNQKLLVDGTMNLYDYELYLQIPCMQIVGDNIYFSYGAYDGTAYMYQGGQIARVNKDGSGLTILAGNEQAGEEAYTYLINDMFYVSNLNGNEILHYSGVDGDSYALHLSNNRIEKTFSNIQPEGKPFENEEGISIYTNASPTAATLLTRIDYDKLGLDPSTEYYNTIKDVQQCGDWVYYRLEANEYYPDASIGWRDGYRRIKTMVLREKLDGSEAETLFQY